MNELSNVDYKFARSGDDSEHLAVRAIGAFPDAGYKSRSLRIGPGDRLLLPDDFSLMRVRF